MTGGDKVRLLEYGDLPELVCLCREHAAFERASWSNEEREAGLASAFLDTKTARCWVVDTRGELAGFASASLELSTWHAKSYFHLDCLFLRAAHRGKGWGQALVQQAARAAIELGAVNLQWQTPSWNQRAVSFYQRLGAQSAKKLRFTLSREACAALAHPRLKARATSLEHQHSGAYRSQGS